MLKLGNTESRRACALIEALDEHEITLNEFKMAIEPLTSEALWMTAMVMAADWDDDHCRMRRLWRARLACRSLAEARRSRN